MKFKIGDVVRIIKTGDIYSITGITTIYQDKIKGGNLQTDKLLGYRLSNPEIFPQLDDQIEKVEADNSNSTYINIDNQIIFDKSEFAAAKLSDKGNTIIIMNNGERHLINGNHIYEIDFKLRR